MPSAVLVVKTSVFVLASLRLFAMAFLGPCHSTVGQIQHVIFLAPPPFVEVWMLVAILSEVPVGPARLRARSITATSIISSMGPRMTSFTMT